MSQFPARLRQSTGREPLRMATCVAVAAFLVDWATKSWALNTVHDATLPLGSLVLGVARNDAFVFSSGTGRVPPAVIAAARLLVLIAVLFVSRHFIFASRRCAVGLALLTAGGLGNAADVMFRDGAVVDFIGAGPFAFSWPGGEPVHLTLVFNIADVAILVGLGLLAPMIQQLAIAAQHQLLIRARALARRLAAGT